MQQIPQMPQMPFMQNMQNMQPMQHIYQHVYNVGLFDDLHNYLPDLLYNNTRFNSVQDVFQYMNQMMQYNFDRYTNATRVMRPVALAPVPVPVAAAPVPAPLLPTPPLTPLLFPQTPPMAPVPRNLQIPNVLFFINDIMNMSQRTGGPDMNTVMANTTIRTAQPTDSDRVCPICHEHFTENDMMRTINHCNHAFHCACIDIWFGRSSACPVCRHDIRGGHIDLGDEGDIDSD